MGVEGEGVTVGVEDGTTTLGLTLLEISVAPESTTSEVSPEETIGVLLTNLLE